MSPFIHGWLNRGSVAVIVLCCADPHLHQDLHRDLRRIQNTLELQSLVRKQEGLEYNRQKKKAQSERDYQDMGIRTPEQILRDMRKRDE